MHVLITSATGYLGSNLALALAREGMIVHALVRNPDSPFLPRHENIRAFAGHLNDIDSIAKAVDGCEQVYHTAAVASLHPKDNSILFKVNVEGTRNLLEQSLRAGVQRFLFTSTCSVYRSSGDGIANEETAPPEAFVNDYERSKFLADELVSSYSESAMETVTVHLTRVFGPGPETHPMSVNQIIRRCAKGAVCICPRPLSIISNYTFIDDVVRGHMLAMKNGRNCERYILAGENLSYRALFDKLAETFGQEAKTFAAPYWLAYTLGLVNEAKAFIGKSEAAFTHRDVRIAYSNRAFSAQKAIDELGYVITPFVEALGSNRAFYER